MDASILGNESDANTPGSRYQLVPSEGDAEQNRVERKNGLIKRAPMPESSFSNFVRQSMNHTLGHLNGQMQWTLFIHNPAKAELQFLCRLK